MGLTIEGVRPLRRGDSDTGRVVCNLWSAGLDQKRQWSGTRCVAVAVLARRTWDFVAQLGVSDNAILILHLFLFWCWSRMCVASLIVGCVLLPLGGSAPAVRLPSVKGTILVDGVLDSI